MTRSGHAVRGWASLACLVLASAGLEAAWARASTVPTQPEVLDAPRMLVLPVANFTGRHEAIATVVPRLYAELHRHEVSFLSHEDLRPVLRRERIRGVGGIGRADAQWLGRETGAREILLISLDLYRDDLTVEVGLSGRILDLGTLSIVAAASRGATGETYTGSFGMGRIENVQELAKKTVAELVEALLDETPPVSKPGCRRVAVVPFDNTSQLDHAGRILENSLITQLVASGFDVVEPGFLNEQFLGQRVMFRGSIDLDTLRGAREALGICYALTGMVDHMQPARSTAAASIPELVFGARMLDATSGAIVTTFDLEADGARAETFFGHGRRSSLSRLLTDVLGKLVERIDETSLEQPNEQVQP